MKGFNKSAEVLEFQTVLSEISGRCVSESGKSRILNSTPLQSKEQLKTVLAQVSEMREIYTFEGGFPLWSYYDIRILIKAMEPQNSFLESEDFLKLRNLLELTVDIADFLKKITGKYPNIHKAFSGLNPQKKLLNTLNFTFEPSGSIFDNASPALKQIRKEIEGLDSEIHVIVNRVLRKHKEHIQEEYITLRDGRLVIPVREFSVSKVPGIVHGQSGSGQTYFVEPMAVVDLNNQLLQRRTEEKKEIIKILKRLTDMVREEQDILLQNFHILNEADVLQAKARYANEFHCSAPQISEYFHWELKEAKHPLLLKNHPDSTVPLNCSFGDSILQLIISGPNAGGKTVALKTIGLMQLFFQSGFHIPAAEGSHLPLCKQVYALIGDEQSLEHDLSTFSSHVNGLNDIVKNCREESLILIDEIGSGTEPGGGAALAISFLEYMKHPLIATIATTHQNQIKVYGGETDGVENAAMQFDMEHLTPLFTLETGIPGSSYTFEICKRLGLNKDILEEAKNKAGSEAFELDKLLVDVNTVSQRYRKLSADLSIKESHLDALIKLNEDRNQELKKVSKNFEKKAKDEAAEILSSANRDIEKAIREIRESQADKKVVKNVRQELEEKKKSLLSVPADKKVKTVELSAIKKGQRVRSVQYQITGNINKIFKGKNEVEIEKEGLKLTVPVSDIEILNENGQVQKSKAVEQIVNSPLNIHNELDLRGLMTEEAILELQSYIDKAILSNWNEVRIVHGKGTGTLRKAVQQYLSSVKEIKSFRMGKWGEGDSGVTVVEV